MKKIFLFLFFVCVNLSAQNYKVNDYHLKIALEKAHNRAVLWTNLINSMPTEEKKNAAKFLVAYMPERDLLLLDPKLIANNIHFAFLAKEKFPWVKNIPTAVFFNDVLPYFCLNEKRDDWRQTFYEKFAPLVADCNSIKEAATLINKHIADILNVKYSTQRKRADQSPFESMQSGLASCSGLSILLTNAFRSVGIPSRIAGIAFWANKLGNHNWSELWFDDQWHFAEYYPDEKGFNHSWFVEDCAFADAQNWQHSIYASSFSHQPYYFPLVWDFNLRWISAVNRTNFYKNMGLKLLTNKKDFQQVAIVAYNLATKQRQKQKITIIQNDKIVFSGATRD
ncbi:MAG: transglutaminase-like domain-containing protein, partial [Lentisphaeria bacterium]